MSIAIQVMLHNALLFCLFGELLPNAPILLIAELSPAPASAGLRFVLFQTKKGSTASASCVSTVEYSSQ